jgi:hypothetical protein
MYDVSHQGVHMRTTISLADDVFYAAKASAQATGSTIGDVVSDWARNGFAPTDLKDAPVTPSLRNGIAVLPRRGVRVTSEQVYKLLDEEGA